MVDGKASLYALRVRAGEIAPIPPEPSGETKLGPNVKGPDAALKPAAEHAAPVRKGISPAWFWGGLGVTAVLGGVTAWSGVDALKRHSDFEATPTADLQSSGKSAQLRTNVLIGVTSAVGLATLLVAVVAVRWGGAEGAPESGTKTAAQGIAVAPWLDGDGAGVWAAGRF